MEALKNESALKHERIRNEYIRLIDIGSDSMATVRHLALAENYSTQNVFLILRKAGLTGPNGYKKKESVQDTQPA